MQRIGANGTTTNATATTGGSSGSATTSSTPEQATTNSAIGKDFDSMGALAAILCVLAFFA